MTPDILFLMLCVLLATQSSTAQNTNSCYSNETSCLSELRQLLVDNNRFWFGSSFAKSCPEGPLSAPECGNRDLTRKSILSRLLSLDDTDASLSERARNISLPRVTYDVPAGNFLACGHNFDVPALNNYLIDPLIITRVSLWSLSFRPTVTWTPRSQGTSQTLLIWDTGNFYIHGLYVNCVNGSMKTGEVVWPYVGPLSPYLRHNTYVFAVYEQVGHIDVTAARKFIEASRALEPATFISNFTSRNNSNPTHAGIMTILGDPYAVQTIYSQRSTINYCPYLISQLDVFHAVVRASNLSVPWSDNTTTMTLYSNATYLTGLTTNIEVRYDTDDWSVESCCTNYSIMRGTTLVDPFSSQTVRPGNIRLKPLVQLTPVNLRSSKRISEAYTLFLLNVAAALSPSASEPVYVTHWLVTNIRNADVIRGDEVAPYFAPNPSTANDHRPYIFLLFRQPVETLNNTIFSTFCPNGNLRCRTQLKPVLEAWNLTEIVGMTWFLAEQDAFTRYRLYSVIQASTKDSVCKGLPGYAEPCPQDCPDKGNTGASHKTRYSLAVFLLLARVSCYLNLA